MKPANAVAAIITNNKNEVLLQHRDAIPNIFYPSYWGCFGGGVEAGETLEDAIARELREELGINNFIFNYFSSISLDFSPIGGGSVNRVYFHSSIEPLEIAQIKLGEGSGYEFLAEERIADYLITPYDKFALDLYFAANETGINF